MNGSLLEVASYTLVAVGALAVGGSAGLFFRPSRHVATYVMHFAAGVVVSVLSVELLPEVQQMRTGVAHVIGGFAAGTVAMLALMAWTHRVGSDSEREAFPWGLMLATAIDVAIDGMTIGTGFAASPATGRLLAIGLATELVPLGLSVSSSLARARVSRARSAALIVSLAILPGITAVSASLVLRQAPRSLLVVIFSFGAAALLYLVTEELLVEAHEHRQTTGDTTMFFVGFLTVLILGMTMG